MDKFVPIFGSKEFSTFIVSATAGSFAIELVYLILAFAAFGLLAKHGGTWWQYLIVAVAVATPILGFYGALDPAPHDGNNPNWLAFYWALAVVVLSAVWYGLMQVWKPERIETRHRMPRCTAASRRSTSSSTTPRRHRIPPSDDSSPLTAGRARAARPAAMHGPGRVL